MKNKKKGLSAILRVDAQNDAVFRQFVGGIDPDSTRALPLRSDSESEAHEAQIPKLDNQKERTQDTRLGNLSSFVLS